MKFMIVLTFLKIQWLLFSLNVKAPIEHGHEIWMPFIYKFSFTKIRNKILQKNLHDQPRSENNSER